MLPTTNGPHLHAPNLNLLLAYVADLELEVDRLRRQGRFVQQEARDTLTRIRSLCGPEARTDAAAALPAIDQAAAHLAGVISDLREVPGYHPAHDQVVAIAVRPLVEQVFRSQQRLAGAMQTSLRLELEADHVDWFPARLRHVLDNLLSNSLKYRDLAKAECWVAVGMRATEDGHELWVRDNGLGLPAGRTGQMFELLQRAAPARAAGLGVGLAVVKSLVEQSGGSMTVDSGEGQGTTFAVTLPRYELADHLG